MALMAYSPDPISQRILQLWSPVTDDDLKLVTSSTRVVQFSGSMTDTDHRKIASVLERFPNVPLRVYGSVSDLEFLSNYPNLKQFQVDVFQLGSIDGLRHLSPELEYLGLGQTKKNMSLKVLGKFARLKELYLEKHTKDIEVISSLTTLGRLNLRSVTLKDLSILLPLKKLWWFSLKLGGTTNLSQLSQIGRIKYLELWMVRGLADISFISDMTTLQHILLQDLKNIKNLPSFSKCTSLRRISIVNLKGLTDVSQLLTAPALEELTIGSSNTISVQNVLVLKQHPKLKKASIGLGSVKRNIAVKDGLDLPPQNFFEEFKYS